MVSKIAVIALVAVIAVPIMAGYALNLEEETGYRYEESGQPLNVTPYLQNSIEYSYSNVDVYTLNSQHNMGIKSFSALYPRYESFSNTRSSVQLNVTEYTNGALPTPITLSGLKIMQVMFDYPATHNAIYHYPNVNVFVDYGGGNIFYANYSRIISLSYDPTNNNALGSPVLNIVYYYSDGTVTTAYVTDTSRVEFTLTNDWQGSATVYTQTENNPTGQYVNFVDGFRLNPSGNANSVKLAYTQINNTMDLKNELFTLNLDSITRPNAQFSINGNSGDLEYSAYHSWIEFEKNTVNGTVSWTARTCQRADYSSPIVITETIDLYYNPDGNNTYQLLLDHYGGELRYVGAWPSTMGPANVYMVYPFTLRDGSFNENPVFLGPTVFYGYTPIMRIDGAVARAFVSNIIEDATYSPGVFKDNPSTTITDLKVVGTSLTFGGHTYAATKDGYITLNGHKVPINKLSFNSIPGENGTYDNRIGDDVISNTPEPATLTFNGRWGANVQTISQAETTYTETKWIAGDFAFNGIDSQFLMVGLITCVGAFIALGIYGRRSGTKVLPLMLVCAGAGILFLLMI